MIGRFRLLKAVRVLDFDALENIFETGSYFDPGFGKRLERAVFLERLVAELCKPTITTSDITEYLPTQVVAEYLAAFHHLDGIVFRSSQMDRKSRNLVLFNQVAHVKEYDLPKGTKVDVSLGWRTEDDWDDSIFVSEEVPSEQDQVEKLDDDVSGLLLPAELALPADAASATVPVLELLVNEVEVRSISSVSFGTKKRTVLRHRSVESKGNSSTRL